MQVTINKKSGNTSNVYECSLGDFLGRISIASIPDAPFVAELDTDDIFRVGENLIVLTSETHSHIEINDGKNNLVGVVEEIYDNQTLLMRILEAALIIEYEGIVKKGQWIKLIAETLEIFPVNI